MRTQKQKTAEIFPFLFLVFPFLYSVLNGKTRRCVEINVRSGNIAPEEGLTLKCQMFNRYTFQVSQGRSLAESGVRTTPSMSCVSIEPPHHLSQSRFIFKMEITELLLTIGYL